MIKYLVSLLVPTALVLFLFHELGDSNLYSDAELREVSERAVALAREQRYAEDEEQFQAVIAISPGYLPARADHLVVLYWQQRYGDMLKRAERLPWQKLPGYALEALALAALAEEQPGRAGDYAEQALREGAGTVEERADRALLLGRQLLLASEPDLAQKLFEQGLAVQPENSLLRASLELARLPLWQELPVNGVLHGLRRDYLLEPGRGTGLNLARALIDQGEAEAAAVLLHSLGAATAEDAGLALALAYAREQQGEQSAAAEQFARALALGAAGEELYDSWLAALARAPEEEALRPLHRHLAAAATTPAKVRRNYGRGLAKQRAWSALSELVATSGAPGELADMLGQQAWQARQQRRHADALALVEIGLEHYPERQDFPLARALVLSEAGEGAAADQALADLLARRPHSLQVLDAALSHARRHGTARQQRDLLRRLVEQDASGRYVEAWLAMLADEEAAAARASLQALHGRWPGEARIGVALAVRHQQAGECAAAREVLAGLRPRPELAATAGYVARSCQAPELAERWYRRGLAERPERELQAGLMLALARQGRQSEADALYRELARERGDASVEQALADYAMAGERWDAALVHYRRLSALRPDHRDAWRGQTLALARAGRAGEALERARQRPDWFSPAERADFHAGAALALLAEAEAEEGEARGLQQRALALLEQGLREQEPDSEPWLKLDNDRLVVLGRLGRDEELLAGVAARRQLPDYVLLELSDVHLRRGEADRALAQVAAVAARHPDDEGLQRRLFYAHLDAGQEAEAEQVLAVLADRARANWDPAGDAPLPWALRQQALVDAWHHRLDAAQRQLERYHDQRPEDDEVRLALATVYRWQGLPTRALALYDDAELHRSRPVAALSGEGWAHWDRRDYGELRRRLGQLEPHRENADAAELRRAWQLARSPQLVGRAHAGRSSGTTFGNREVGTDLWLYSSPLADRYRVFGRQRYAWARLPEGNARLHRGGVGVDYRGRKFGWRAGVDTSLLSQNQQTGVQVSGQWQPDDHWQLSAEAQSYSEDLPLRAIRHGIDGKSVSASARYSWNAQRWLQGGASLLDFSDGNDRTAAWLNHAHPIYGSARHQLSLRESLYTSRGSLGDRVPYYNPERDWAASLTGEYLGRLGARELLSWQHRLALGVGQYWQRGHGGAFIWDVEYEHLWQLTPALHLRLGGLYRQRTYDGSSEGYWAVLGGLDWRF